MDRIIFQGSVPSDLEVVREFLSSATNRLYQYVYDENVRFDLNLIINELVVNGVLHGNEGNRNKSVSLDIGLMVDGIRIRVKDEGKGIQYNPQNDSRNNRRCSGRGLILVKALSDQMVFEENEVIVIVNF